MDNLETSKKTSDRAHYALAIRIAADFSAGIAIPAVLAAFTGVWLDERFGTKPWLLAACLVIAFVLTAFYIVRKAKYYAKLYDRS